MCFPAACAGSSPRAGKISSSLLRHRLPRRLGTKKMVRRAKSRPDLEFPGNLLFWQASGTQLMSTLTDLLHPWAGLVFLTVPAV